MSSDMSLTKNVSNEYMRRPHINECLCKCICFGLCIGIPRDVFSLSLLLTFEWKITVVIPVIPVCLQQQSFRKMTTSS